MPDARHIIIEDARIRFRNFEGRQGMYNKAGDKNFVVLLDPDLAQDLANEGWVIKQLKPRDEDEDPQPYLSVSVKYHDNPFPPTIKVVTSRGTTELDDESVEMLDHVEIGNVDLIIRPFDWSFNGNSGRKAMLKSMYVTIIEDPLDLKYNNTQEIATIDGPMMERTVALEPEF
jgi:hypothetical protein